MERKLKKEYGITLVALVITIIILLILSVVAINTLTQTGLFENAKQAKNTTENAQKDENKTLGEYSSKINEYVSGTSRDEASSEVFKKIEETSTVNTYSYTGSEQEYTVPEDGYYKIECWGAQGGTYSKAIGGKGAYTKGIIKLTKGEKLYIYVGECYNGAKETMCYNGGGSGGYSTVGIETGTNGGGATDIRLLNGNWNDFESLKSRIMVAGGGGGSYSRTSHSDYSDGGQGGALIGMDGNIYSEVTEKKLKPATGATQIAGGSNSDSSLPNNYTGLFGSGGYAEFSREWNSRSGGGGGYYGGGAGVWGKGEVSSGSGGSSYISGYDGCNSIAESSTEENIIHTGNIIHYSGKYFLYTRMESGRNYMPSQSDTTTEVQGNSGNGYAKITKMKVENF